MSDSNDATRRYEMTIKMFGADAEPAFESSEQQTKVWGRQWGCDNDVGRLRAVLVHRPGDEMKVVDPSKRIESLGSFGDLEEGWYFGRATRFRPSARCRRNTTPWWTRWWRKGYRAVEDLARS